MGPHASAPSLEVAEWMGMVAGHTFAVGEAVHIEERWVEIVLGGASRGVHDASLGDMDSVGEVDQLGRTPWEDSRARLGVDRLWRGSSPHQSSPSAEEGIPHCICHNSLSKCTVNWNRC